MRILYFIKILLSVCKMMWFHPILIAGGYSLYHRKAYGQTQKLRTVVRQTDYTSIALTKFPKADRLPNPDLANIVLNLS